MTDWKDKSAFDHRTLFGEEIGSQLNAQFALVIEELKTPTTILYGRCDCAQGRIQKRYVKGDNHTCFHCKSVIAQVTPPSNIEELEQRLTYAEEGFKRHILSGRCDEPCSACSFLRSEKHIAQRAYDIALSRSQ